MTLTMITDWMNDWQYANGGSSLYEIGSRSITLTGCFNFRDIGGYPSCRDRIGRNTSWRTLFRSDGLGGLTSSDMALLTSLGLKTVVDLRTAEEVKRDGAIPNFNCKLAYEHLAFSDCIPGSESFAAWIDPDFVADRYLEMLDNAEPVIIRILEMLADRANLPAVIHCSVGKDRTGIVVAMLLGLLGVDDSVIIQDYKLSRHPVSRMLKSILEDGEVDEVIKNFPTTVLPTEPRAMAGFLERFRQRHGSFEAYSAYLGAGSLIELVASNLLT